MSVKSFCFSILLNYFFFYFLTHAELFVSNGTCILKFNSPSLPSIPVFCKNSSKIIAFDVEVYDGLVIFADNQFHSRVIYKVDLQSGNNITKIVSDEDINLGVITGLAIDSSNKRFYWSDEVYKQIVSANYDGKMIHVTLHDNLLLPRGIAIDQINGLLFWNDQGKKSIEMSRMDGSNRVQISYQSNKNLNQSLNLPNQMIFQSINQFEKKLFFVDAGDKKLKSIEISFISNSQQFTKSPLSFLNSINSSRQTSFSFSSYSFSPTFPPPPPIPVSPGSFSDSTIRISPIKTEFTFDTLEKDDYLFGLTFQNSSSSNSFFISTWKSCSIIQLDLKTKNFSNFSKVACDSSLFSLKETQFLSKTERPSSSCSSHNCSHICFNLRIKNGSGFKCDCPTFGGLHLSEDLISCKEPKEIVIYADLFYGHIGWFDPVVSLKKSKPQPPPQPPSKPTTNNSCQDSKLFCLYDYLNSDFFVHFTSNRLLWQPLHLVAEAKKPVAVAFNPVDKMVYWSDQEIQQIMKKRFNSYSRPSSLFPSSSRLGYVDGLYLDHHSNLLYFTNYDFSSIGGNFYSKSLVEVVQLTFDLPRRILFWNYDKPRGIWLDQESNFLFSSFIGSEPLVLRTSSSGFFQKKIKFKENEPFFNSPNSMVSKNKTLIILDSFFKKKTENKTINPKLFIIDDLTTLTSTNVIDLHSIEIPFGLTIINSLSNSDSKNLSNLLISDWGRGCIWMTGFLGDDPQVLLGSSIVKQPSQLVTATLNGIFEVPQNSCVSDKSGSLCFQNDNQTQILCPSYLTDVLFTSKNSCYDPNNLVIMSDLMSLKLLNLTPSKNQEFLVLEEGNYKNSFSSLTFDSSSNLLYFSDVNNKTIKTKSLITGEKKTIATGKIADDLLLEGEMLYWISYESSQLNSKPINSSVSQYQIIKSFEQNLKPKSLSLFRKLMIFFITFDDEPRVSLVPLSTSSFSNNLFSYFIEHVKSPADTYVNEDENQLFVMDRYSGNVVKCNLSELSFILKSSFNSLNCSLVVSLSQYHEASTFYSFVVLQEAIYFSIWSNFSSCNCSNPRGAFLFFDILSKNLTKISTSLTRPTKFFIKTDQKNTSCSNSSCPIGGSHCIIYNGFETCNCPSYPHLPFSHSDCNSKEELSLYSINDCPMNKSVYTRSNSSIVWWSKPKLTFFSSTSQKESLILLANHDPGSSFLIGQTKIIYNVNRSNDNFNKCQFDIFVYKLNVNCSKNFPQTTNSELECQETRGGGVECKVSCFKGFVFFKKKNSSFAYTFKQDQLSCHGNEWTSENKQYTGSLICFETSVLNTTRRFKIFLDLPCRQLNLNDQSLITQFIYSLYEINLCPNVKNNAKSDVCNVKNYKKTTCGKPPSLATTPLNPTISPNSKSFVTKIENLSTIEVTSSINNNGEKKNRKRRKRMSEEENKTIIELELEKNEDFGSSISRLSDAINQKKINFQFNRQKYSVIGMEQMSTEDCGIDQMRLEDQCVKCSQGSMFNKTSGFCELCRPNFYQSSSGQTSCIQCPNQKPYSISGSYDLSMCLTKENFTLIYGNFPSNEPQREGQNQSNLSLILGLVFGLGIPLLILLLIIVFCLKKKENEKLDMEERRRGWEAQTSQFPTNQSSNSISLSHYSSPDRMSVNRKENENFGFESGEREEVGFDRRTSKENNSITPV